MAAARDVVGIKACCSKSVQDETEGVPLMMNDSSAITWPRAYSKFEHDKLMEEHAIPGWAYSRQVSMLTCVNRETQGMPKVLPIMCVCGPAVRLTRLAMWITWPAIFSIAYVSYNLSTCDEDVIVSYPLWLWALFLPVAVVRLWMEFKALRYPLVPYVQVTKQLTLGPINPPFWLWFMGMGMLSALNLTDLVTDSLFLATCFRLQACAWDKVQHAMKVVAKDSVFGKVLGPIFYENVTLKGVAAVFYLLSLVQLIVSLLEMYPMRNEKVDYVVACDPPSVPEADRKCFMYSTYMTGAGGHKTNHFEAMVSGADTTGMVSISKMALNYPYWKAKLLIEQNNGKVIHSVLEMHMTHFLKGGSKRAFYTMFLETGFQVNLQITLLGMNMAMASKDEVNYQAIFSIVTSILVAILDSGMSATSAIFKSSEILSLAKEQIDRGDEDEKFKKEYSKLICLRRGLVASALLTKAMVLYALVKLYFVFHCPDSMWNVSGCVDLHFTSFRAHSSH